MTQEYCENKSRLSKDCNQTLNNNGAQSNTQNINFKDNKYNKLKGVQGTSVRKDLNIVDKLFRLH
jgi:hypothetical protein